jgi:hypothetical protein
VKKKKNNENFQMKFMKLDLSLLNKPFFGCKLIDNFIISNIKRNKIWFKLNKNSF